MRLCFVSNYINHHQIPVCNALHRETDGAFTFIQTEPMEAERVQMGWQEKERPDYVRCYYEEPEWCRQHILDCDAVIFGGTDEESYIQERLAAGKLTVRYSERLYKTGQWKAVSPRGLIKKYKDHTRYCKAPVYLLCSGAYVTSDFGIVRAYPGKKYCWGYFPETKHYDIEKLLEGKGYREAAAEAETQPVPYLLWAARFIDWKHPERALEAARYLKEKGLRFHLDMVGGGALDEKVRELIKTYALEDCVSLLGFRTPAQVRERMEKADIFLMTSDRQEGWGAVANEAMNSGCVLVADHLPGAVPYLVRQGYNGYEYKDGCQEMLNGILEKLVQDRAQCRIIGRRAYETITNTWNAEHAAASLMQLIRELGGQVLPDAEKYRKERVGVRKDRTELAPCMPAPLIRERRRVKAPVFVPEKREAFSFAGAEFDPLLTIIVPVYNILEYLPRCVHSITAQTYKNLEILLVDDGSTDGTGELCDKLAAEDPRIRVIHKENGGSSSARNLAISQARGAYLGFVDSDDYISPEMYECLYEAIKAYGVSVAQIGRDEIDEAGNLLPNICEPPAAAECLRAEAFMKELLMHRGDCSFCTKLVRKDLLEGQGFPIGKLNEDFHLLVKLLPKIGRVASLPGQTYHVFYRIGSNTRKKDKEQFSRVYGDNVENADMVMGIVREYYPELTKIALRFGVFQRLDYLLHIPISQMKKDNGQYRAIVRWMRFHWLRAMGNPHLTVKNKVYHTLFALAPRMVRMLHRRFWLKEAD